VIGAFLFQVAILSLAISKNLRSRPGRQSVVTSA
jgi:hypothetical protein